MKGIENRNSRFGFLRLFPPQLHLPLPLPASAVLSDDRWPSEGRRYILLATIDENGSKSRVDGAGAVRGLRYSQTIYVGEKRIPGEQRGLGPTGKLLRVEIFNAQQEPPEKADRDAG